MYRSMVDPKRLWMLMLIVDEKIENAKEFYGLCGYEK